MKKTELAVRLTNACTCVSEAEDILTEIDSKFGDADHGLTMTKIAKAISQAVAEADGGIQSMLDAAAMAVMMLNGGSASPCGTPGWTVCRRPPPPATRLTWPA